MEPSPRMWRILVFTSAAAGVTELFTSNWNAATAWIIAAGGAYLLSVYQAERDAVFAIIQKYDKCKP